MTVEMTLKSDSLLVKEYQLGNENALAILLERHQERVYSYIFYKIHDREVTEDLFQDTFVKIITTLKEKRYCDEGKFVNWCLRIAHNIVIDYYRVNRNKNLVSETSYTSEEFSIFDYISDKADNIEQFIIKKQIVEDIRQMIVYLPQEQQDVIDLRLFKDLSFKEIAEELNISINTALGRMRYAVINLRKLVERHNKVLNY